MALIGADGKGWQRQRPNKIPPALLPPKVHGISGDERRLAVSASCLCSFRLKLKSILSRFQLRNRRHDFIGDLLVNFLEPRLGTILCLGAQGFKLHRPAIFHRHPFGPGKFDVPPVSLERSKRPHRHDRRVGLDHHQTDAGARGLQPAVARPRAFGK